MRGLFFAIFFTALTFSQNYNVGEVVSTAHQNISKSTCYAGNGYAVNDNWSLADWNGASNGGHYNVIFIDMSASWWGACLTGHQGPAGYEHQDYEDNDHVKFLIAYSDPGQPYSCTQWGNFPQGGSSQIIHDTSSEIWGHFMLDNYFPSTVWIDHEMRVYDKLNNAGSWSIGSRIDAMLDSCGSLCEDGGCTTALGDLNEDEILNIQDLITMVNHILSISVLQECPLEAADMNVDGIINIQDLISLVNAILGNGRLSKLDGNANIQYDFINEGLMLSIKSDIEISGIQLSIMNDLPVEVELKDNSHITQESSFIDGINRYLAYSIFNQSFDGHYTDLLIKSDVNLDIDKIYITIADINGDALEVTYIESNNQSKYIEPSSFELGELYPNPFNPSTQVNFKLPVDSHVKLSAYDVRGQEVGIIFEGAQSIGSHSYIWNASNLPSGVYYVRLQAGSMVASQKALLIK